MTEQEAQDALLKFLKILDYQYVAPQPLSPDECPAPLLHPVVTAYDNDADLQVFVVCIVNPDESKQASDWVNGLAQQIMAQWAPPGEEPLEYDTAVWIGEAVRP